MLPHTWAEGLGKITGISRGTWKNSGISSGGEGVIGFANSMFRGYLRENT